MDGKDVVKAIREWSAVPVPILSVRGAVAEKTEALDAGADGHGTKPFATGGLPARLRVLLRNRRPGEEAPAVFEAKGLALDRARATRERRRHGSEADAQE